LLGFFVFEVTARSAADLLGIQPNTAILFYQKIQQGNTKPATQNPAKLVPNLKPNLLQPLLQLFACKPTALRHLVAKRSESKPNAQMRIRVRKKRYWYPKLPGGSLAYPCNCIIHILFGNTQRL